MKFLFHVTKIVKGECRDKRKNLFFKFGYTEPPPFFWKDMKGRAQRQTEEQKVFKVGICK